MREHGFFRREVLERALPELAESGMRLIQKRGPALVERVGGEGLKGVFHGGLGAGEQLQLFRGGLFGLDQTRLGFRDPDLSRGEMPVPLIDEAARGREFSLENRHPLRDGLEAGPFAGDPGEILRSDAALGGLAESATQDEAEDGDHEGSGKRGNRQSEHGHRAHSLLNGRPGEVPFS